MQEAAETGHEKGKHLYDVLDKKNLMVMCVLDTSVAISFSFVCSCSFVVVATVSD